MQRSSVIKPVLIASLMGYAIFMFWILSAANTRTKNGLLSLSNNIPCGDKIGHFFVMGLLALLVNLLLNSRRQSIGKRDFLLGSLFVTVIVTSEECLQIFIPSRTFCFLDLVADYAGILFIGRLALWPPKPRKNLLIRLVKHRVQKACYRGSKRIGLILANRQA